MRKVVAGAVCGLVLGAMSAASADMSVGGGAFFGSNFAGGVKSSVIGIDTKITNPYNGGGLNLFFDADYAEVSVGLMFAGGTMSAEVAGTKLGDFGDNSFTALNLGLLLKYPIPVSEAMNLYPAAGIDYELCVSGKTKVEGFEAKWDGKDGAPKAGDYSRLWVKFGAGLDYNLSEKMFLRPELLYGIGFKSKAEDDMIKEMKDEYDAEEDIFDLKPDVKANLSHGLTIKVGIGFRL